MAKTHALNTAPRAPSALTKLFSSGRAWSLFPVALLGILVTVQGILFSLSTNDPSFSVEPDYYQKAVQWDQHRHQQLSSARLGWTAHATVSSGKPLGTLRVELHDAGGLPVRFRELYVDAFANARAADVQKLRLSEISPGVYTSPVRISHAGLWELRLQAEQGLINYHETIRLDDVGLVHANPRPASN